MKKYLLIFFDLIFLLFSCDLEEKTNFLNTEDKRKESIEQPSINLNKVQFSEIRPELLQIQEKSSEVQNLGMNPLKIIPIKTRYTYKNRKIEIEKVKIGKKGSSNKWSFSSKTCIFKIKTNNDDSITISEFILGQSKEFGLILLVKQENLQQFKNAILNGGNFIADDKRKEGFNKINQNIQISKKIKNYITKDKNLSKEIFIYLDLPILPKEKYPSAYMFKLTAELEKEFNKLFLN